MATNATSNNFGESKKALTRIEVYLTNEAAGILEKEAAKQSRSRKNYLEILLTAKAVSLKKKK